MVVWGTVVLLEACILLRCSLARFQHSSEVESREDTVVGHHVVFPVRFVVIVVLEGSGIGVT